MPSSDKLLSINCSILPISVFLVTPFSTYWNTTVSPSSLSSPIAPSFSKRFIDNKASPKLPGIKLSKSSPSMGAFKSEGLSRPTGTTSPKPSFFSKDIFESKFIFNSASTNWSINLFLLSFSIFFSRINLSPSSLDTKYLFLLKRPDLD